MRLVKLATASNFERLKPPYVGVTADSVTRLFSPFFLPNKILIHSPHLSPNRAARCPPPQSQIQRPSRPSKVHHLLPTACLLWRTLPQQCQRAFENLVQLVEGADPGGAGHAARRRVDPSCRRTTFQRGGHTSKGEREKRASLVTEKYQTPCEITSHGFIHY